MGSDLFLPQLADPDELSLYRSVLIDVAACMGAELINIEDPPDSVQFAYLPDNLEWPELHVSRMLVNWRIQVVDAARSYCAHWCFPAGVGLESFRFVIDRLLAWGGDPQGEPTGYNKKLDARGGYMWPREPGKLMIETTPPWERRANELA